MTEGHRLSLVFNLCLRPGDDDTPRAAPDHTATVDRLANRLAEWGRARDATDKLVWLLDHGYSEAGLSFGVLKNGDAAVARVLAQAADRAACELYAALVHIEEYGTAEYAGSPDGWGWDGDDDADWEMGDVDDCQQWLDGWVQPEGDQPPFGRVELQPEELLPRGALDDVPPDDQWVHEASGNAGVSVERAYRRTACSTWSRRISGGGRRTRSHSSVASSRRATNPRVRPGTTRCGTPVVRRCWPCPRRCRPSRRGTSSCRSPRTSRACAG